MDETRVSYGVVEVSVPDAADEVEPEEEVEFPYAALSRL
jgi:hypothetical protein